MALAFPVCDPKATITGAWGGKAGAEEGATPSEGCAGGGPLFSSGALTGAITVVGEEELSETATSDPVANAAELSEAGSSAPSLRTVTFFSSEASETAPWR